MLWRRFSEQTQLAAKELLKEPEKEISVKGILDPMVVKTVVDESRKIKEIFLYHANSRSWMLMGHYKILK